MISLFAAFSLHSQVDTAVRATLSDGQILMGEVRTKVLRLATGSGILEVPLADVGEVVPAKRGLLATEAREVDVWLKNGSELRGTWSEPELAMAIAVGGANIGVNLPMNELTRFQLQGAARWPSGPVYRMRTTWGDDFLVDPAKTRVQLENQLGSFAPLLTECRSVAPINDPEGDWRIELETGTVLVGHLKEDRVTLALPMGPKEVTVPLKNFVSLRLESWSPVPMAPPPMPVDRYDDRVSGRAYGGETAAYGQPEYVQTESAAAPTSAPKRESSRKIAGGRAAPSSAKPQDAGWFDSAPLDSAKDAQDPGAE
ncbi:hypothetical protein LBMAG42_23630 [Deltaproteobacteria bacterium]|nr:hypothetical protein LBMAG42_23630 [Deltaproteobacteria bacterium]